MDVGESDGVREFDWRLDGPSVEAFGGALNPLAPGMIAVATLAGTFAKPDHERREIVIDKRALFDAVLIYATRSNVNAAISLTNGLRDQELLPKQSPSDRRRAQPDELVTLHDKKYPVVISASIRNVIIPTARMIAQLTVKRDVIDLRHIIMALLYEPAELTIITNSRLSPKALRRLRAEIVAPLEDSRERGERITVWRKLIDKTPAEVATEMLGEKGGTEVIPPPLSDELPPPNERIKLQLGDPARVDLLDRKPFADVLGDRINEVYALQQGARGKADDQAYIIHLHGPWGSGKSTILNFLRDRLEKGGVGSKQPKWLVVDFNAWKYQRLRPAWWTLMIQIQQAAERGTNGKWARFNLKWRWLWMRFRLGGLSQQFGPIFISIAMVALSFYWFSGDAQSGSDSDQTPAKTLAAIVAAVAGLVGTFNIVRTVTAKSETVAKAHAELISDPYDKVVAQFEKLVKRIDRPIIVFIDDLDRCDAAYVGDLLDNIQTMLRSAPIVYLVAADRAWITTSFGKRYADFNSHSENSARPLGYLFLDKLFQLSVNMPSLSGPVRTRFLNAILGSAEAAAPPTPEVIAAATAAAEIEVSKLDSQEALLAKVDDIKEETPEKQAMRVAVARRLGQTDVKAQTEHRLTHLASLIEPNPRSMKNLVSAVAINQSRLVLEGRSFELDHLARWTIIELRWPLLADWLSQQHERIDRNVGSDDGDDPLVKTMRKLMAEPAVTAVIKPDLTGAIIRDLIG